MSILVIQVIGRSKRKIDEFVQLLNYYYETKVSIRKKGKNFVGKIIVS